jgi:thioredoxin reductase (NADPH)
MNGKFLFHFHKVYNVFSFLYVMKKYDLIIIGAGPAGLTAGLYAVRSGIKSAIISKDIGGTANSILELENWPGFKGSGAELMKKFYEQLKSYDIDFVMANVENIKKEKDEFVIETKNKKLISKAIILATGTERKKLKIKGEEELKGKGVSYCVTCDAFFFKNKIVGVIGGSDCAATSALALSDLAEKVYVIYRGGELRCEDINANRLEDRKNVEIRYDAVLKEIKGEEKVESLIIKEKGKDKEIKLDGIFIEIGSTPLTKFAQDLKLKLDNNYIIVDEEMKTSVSGVFAAGDVIHQRLKQVVVASGQGAIAAKSAYEYLKK